MDWQEKAAALDALAEIEIRFRKPGDWFVNQDVAIKDDHCLVGAWGNGETPQAAIEDHWKVLVEEPKFPLYLVARSGDRRRAVSWNGFMWADVHEPKQEKA
jgi:hypothetical protein